MWLVLYMIGFFFLFLFPFTRLFWVTRDITIKVGILKVHSFYITHLIIWAVLSTHNLHWNALRFHGISKSTKHGITHEWRRYRMMTVSFLISDEIHIERVSYSVEHAIFIRPMLQTNSIAFYYCLFSNLLPRVQTCWFHILPRAVEYDIIIHAVRSSVSNNCCWLRDMLAVITSLIHVDFNLLWKAQ